MANLVTITDGLPNIYGTEFNAPINLCIQENEHPTIIGANGSGKTLLAELLCGRISLRSGKITTSYKIGDVIRASFESAYLLADYSSMYYQQRFSASENQTTPTVCQLIEKISCSEKEFWINKLQLKPLFEKHLIMLSSGELRRFLIATLLMRNPDIIIFDNPFIGLDIATRNDLNNLFSEIATKQQMIFIVPDINEIPNVSTKIIPLANLKCYPKIDKQVFLDDKDFQNKIFNNQKTLKPQIPDPLHTDNKPFEYTAILKNITIKYPYRTLFDNFNWTIRRGEKWALLGPNGSGKSTLLSLITADNPRAYSLNITLFDTLRGSGESIWDIKKRIGYISSEMHLFFRENQPCEKICASGLFDTQGLFRKCTTSQLEKARNLLESFGIGNLANRPFLKTSDGEQRLILLARTLIKNPDLLILDEPLHGLDAKNKAIATNVINDFCSQPNKTLIFVSHNYAAIPKCVTKTMKLSY